MKILYKSSSRFQIHFSRSLSILTASSPPKTPLKYSKLLPHSILGLKIIFLHMVWNKANRKHSCKSQLYKNKKGKNLKNTKIVCVCVYWYLCTFNGLWIKISQLCISCRFDEHFHAPLSNVSSMARYVICMVWLIFYHLYSYHSFWRERLQNLKRMT